MKSGSCWGRWRRFRASRGCDHFSVTLARQHGSRSMVVARRFLLPKAPNDTDPRDYLIHLLTNGGLRPTEAQCLVDEELDFKPVIRLKSLTELLEGHYNEKNEWVE